VRVPRLRLVGEDRGDPPRDVIPFPGRAAVAAGALPPGQADDGAAEREPQGPEPRPEAEALVALGEVSRRMNDLARALGVPGYFDEEDDGRPTAA
jgi:hypothetical protein